MAKVSIHSVKSQIADDLESIIDKIMNLKDNNKADILAIGIKEYIQELRKE